jgi:hypothetical protein
MHSTKIFDDRRFYLHEEVIYLERYNIIPNRVIIENIQKKETVEAFESAFASSIVEKISSRRYTNDINRKDRIANAIQTHDYEKAQQIIENKSNDTDEYQIQLFILSSSIIVSFSAGDDMKICYSEENELQKEIVEFGKNKKQKINEEPSISLIVFEYGNLELKSFPVKTSQLTIETHYNDDFQPVHNKIIEKLNADKESGLVLLHGKPGTGKTHYLRYLTTLIKKKMFFVPVNIFPRLNDPDFMSFLYENTNSVMIIEDAERLIIDRGLSDYDAVSSILNLSDGLLSDCLNIQLICSFNTDLHKIDPALLRKGRLISRYYFTELETEKAKKLATQLGMKKIINQPITLADLFSEEDGEDLNIGPVQKKIGF